MQIIVLLHQHSTILIESEKHTHNLVVKKVWKYFDVITIRLSAVVNLIKKIKLISCVELTISVVFSMEQTRFSVQADSVAQTKVSRKRLYAKPFSRSVTSSVCGMFLCFVSALFHFFYHIYLLMRVLSITPQSHTGMIQIISMRVSYNNNKTASLGSCSPDLLEIRVIQRGVFSGWIPLHIIHLFFRF